MFMDLDHALHLEPTHLPLFASSITLWFGPNGYIHHGGGGSDPTDIFTMVVVVRIQVQKATRQ
jgi:hypothetical protein